MKTNISQKNIPKDWQENSFSDCVIIPSKIKGLKSSEYKNDGEFPIFDQGQSYISGYTNEKEFLNTNYPVILFGDHTRILKYINQHFVVGADGTKLIYNNKNMDILFLYYSLLNLNIPNTGYNRHFKFLKDSNILIPPLSEQHHIAIILSSLDEEIKKVGEMIEKSEEMKKGLIERLLITKNIPKDWETKKLNEVVLFRTGKLNSNAAIEDGKYPFFTCSQETFKTNTFSFDQEAILLAGNNAAGNYSVKYFSGKFDAYQRTYVISVLNDKLNYFYLKEFLQDRLIFLKENSVGSTTKFLTIKLLENIKINVPPIKEQERITKILMAVDNKIEMYKKLDNKLLELKKGFMTGLLSGNVRVKNI